VLSNLNSLLAVFSILLLLLPVLVDDILVQPARTDPCKTPFLCSSSLPRAYNPRVLSSPLALAPAIILIMILFLGVVMRPL
jgi:hypothetical protein